MLRFGTKLLIVSLSFTALGGCTETYYRPPISAVFPGPGVDCANQRILQKYWSDMAKKTPNEVVSETHLPVSYNQALAIQSERTRLTCQQSKL